MAAKPDAGAGLRRAVPKRKRLFAVTASGTSTAPAGAAARAALDASRHERLIYDRTRLGIMSALAVRAGVSFNELKALFDQGITDGNLSAHLRKLEDARYVTCEKSFEGRRPKSTYRVTAAGSAALRRYLDHVEAVIATMRPASA